MRIRFDAMLTCPIPSNVKKEAAWPLSIVNDVTRMLPPQCSSHKIFISNYKKLFRDKKYPFSRKYFKHCYIYIYIYIYSIYTYD